MSAFFRNWFPNLEFGGSDPDTIVGSDRRDIIVSFGADDTINAKGGDDLILSGSGNDMIDAGSGDDLVEAGSGDDVIDTGSGDDLVFGGRGFDTVVFGGSIEDYSIELPTRWQRAVKVEGLSNGDNDRLYDIEALYFGADDYTLHLDGRNNSVLARDDEAATDEDISLAIDATDLVANDLEFDGDTKTIVSVSATSLLGVSVTLADGIVTYASAGKFDALAGGETITDSFTYTVSDGKGGNDTATVEVTVTGINDDPEFTTAATASLEENAADVVLTVQATDLDSPTLSYAIAGGDDAAHFEIDAATGELKFVSAADYEAPADADGDNVYEVTVSAMDGQGGEALQDIAVTVTDVDETPPIAPRINEFHYDNDGADTGEFVEIRVGRDADVSTLSLVLYNGSNGLTYGSPLAIAGNLVGSDDDYDYYVIATTGLQNGSPDGIALVDAGAVVEFLSYEGSFTAANGPASGHASVDIGQSQGGSDPVGLTLQRTGDAPTDWDAPRAGTGGAANDVVTPAFEGRINEFHYDDDSTDAGEFVEVRVAQGSDVSQASVILYNGNGGTTYGTFALAGNLAGSDADYDYYVISTPGLQNGSPDGIALVNAGGVVEFLSYEGSFLATNGPAGGMTSTDIGASEGGSDPDGLSLQRVGDGPTDWDAPRDETPGAANDPAGPALLINEIAVSTTGTDWEFVELFGDAGLSLDGFSLIQVDGDGDVRSVVALDGEAIGTNGYFLAASPQAGSTFGVAGDLEIANNTFTNVASTFLLVEGFAGSVGTDLDIDNDGAIDAGSFTSAADSVALIDGNPSLSYSTNIVGPDGTFLAPGAARSPDGSGPFVMTSFDSTAGYTPTAGGSTGGGRDPVAMLISEIQGTGTASMVDGAYVVVSAVVTYTVGDGFYLQEEMVDSDGNALTSEGIFVYTGGAPSVATGDLVEVTATVDEFFGLTELTDVTSLITVSSGNALPDYADVTLPLASADALEQFEGMLISLTSSTSDPITVIENFSLGQYGEITVSAGNQYQPTQLYDPDTQSAEIAALQQANSLNRLVIDDGVSSQNQDGFEYIPASVGDNGNGYLDAGDTFTADGPTIRLGAELDAPALGVLSYGFDAYRMLVEGQLPIDQATNTGARQDSPADVGGTVTVSSFNLLNFFTTLDDGVSGGSGPNNLEPRGATTAGDFERQLEKIVASMVEIGADVFGLQELENNGFATGSAIATLVDALNSALGAEIYAFVDPTGGSVDGFIGTDAITTGVIYNQTTLSVVGSDFLVFDDGGTPRTRPAIAVAFEEIATGEVFNVAVNHFKSKGGTGSGDDADIGDGQGAFNGTRTRAAEQLADWLATDPTGSGDSDTLIIGDLNSYAQEDPVDVLRDAGYTDLIDLFIGQDNAYSYVFDGQRGTLDQGLATSSLAGQITGMTEWHINADEPGLLSYSTEFNNPAFYNGDVFATSDHDPLIIGLQLGDYIV